jgi:hypothetical protein
MAQDMHAVLLGIYKPSLDPCSYSCTFPYTAVTLFVQAMLSLTACSQQDNAEECAAWQCSSSALQFWSLHLQKAPMHMLRIQQLR